MVRWVFFSIIEYFQMVKCRVSNILREGQNSEHKTYSRRIVPQIKKNAKASIHFTAGISNLFVETAAFSFFFTGAAQ
jgi:hypothetical protein